MTHNFSFDDSPKFPLGQVVATPGVLEVLVPEEMMDFLRRHAHGDWGTLYEEDKIANNQALTSGGQILSAYITSNGRKVWVITEGDRSVTTLLLPSEY